jgi:putative polyhydroxyalkanoate system protein
MATIAIAKKHALSHKKAKEAAQKVAEDLNKRFDLDYTWNGDCIDFTRPGLTGQLHILKDEVRLDCKLGFLLGAIKGAIEREVHKEFDHRFGKHAEHKETKEHKEATGHKEAKGRKA